MLLIEELALGEFTQEVLGKAPIVRLSAAAINVMRALAVTIRCGWRTGEARRAGFQSIAHDGSSADCRVSEGGKAKRRAQSRI